MTGLEGRERGVRRAGGVGRGLLLPALNHGAIPAVPDVGHEVIKDDSPGASGRVAPVCLILFWREILITCEIENLFSDSAARSDSAKRAGMSSLSSIPGSERPPQSHRPLPAAWAVLADGSPHPTRRKAPASHRAVNPVELSDGKGSSPCLAPGSGQKSAAHTAGWGSLAASGTDAPRSATEGTCPVSPE